MREAGVHSTHIKNRKLQIESMPGQARLVSIHAGLRSRPKIWNMPCAVVAPMKHNSSHRHCLIIPCVPSQVLSCRISYLYTSLMNPHSLVTASRSQPHYVRNSHRIFPGLCLPQLVLAVYRGRNSMRLVADQGHLEEVEVSICFF